MKEQADATEAIAKAAKSSADAANVSAKASQRLAQNAVDMLRNTQGEFRDEQRAWVGVEQVTGIAPNEKDSWKVTVMFFNSGKTAARDVQTSGMYKESPVAISGPTSHEAKSLWFRPAQSIAPQGRYFETIGTTTGGEPTTGIQAHGQAVLVSQISKAADSYCTTTGYLAIATSSDTAEKLSTASSWRTRRPGNPHSAILSTT